MELEEVNAIFSTFFLFLVPFVFPQPQIPLRAIQDTFSRTCYVSNFKLKGGNIN